MPMLENGLRPKAQIEEQLNLALEHTSEGKTTRYRSMSYEDGVQAALAWVVAESEDEPMEVEGA